MLSTSLIPIRFKGLNTKADDKQLVPGELVLLENCVFDKLGKLRKRKAYDSTESLGSDTYSKFLGVYKNELLVGTNNSLFSYKKYAQTFQSLGAISSVGIKVQDIIRNSQEQNKIDMCITSSFKCYAWEDSRGGIYYRIEDKETGMPIVADTQASSTGTAPKWVVLRDIPYLCGLENGSGVFFTSFNGTSLNTKSYVGSGSAASYNVIPVEYTFNDEVGFYSHAVLAIDDGGTVDNNVVAFDSNGSVVSSQFKSGLDNNISLSYDWYNQRIIIVYNSSTTSLVACYATFDYTTGVLGVPTSSNTLDTTSGDIKNLTCVYLGDQRTKVFYEEAGGSAKYNKVKSCTVAGNATLVSGSVNVYQYGVGLASEAFILDSANNDNGFPDTITDYGRVLLVNETTLQSTYWVSTNLATGASENIINGKILYGLATGVKSGKHLPSVSYDRVNDLFYLAQPVKSKLETENSTTFTKKGVAQIELDFNFKPQIVQFGDTAFINNGRVLTYDSNSLIETGFDLFPEDISSSVSSSGGSMAAGTYQYVVVWEWIDNSGNIVRSAPSIPLSVVQSSGSTNKATLTIPTLKITNKKSTRTNPVVALYRTEANGTTFYKVSSTSSPTYNAPTSDSVSIEDTLADASILGNEILYTTGDILENIAPPSALALFTAKNRLWAVSSDDPNLLWASKPYSKGEAVGFNEVYQVRVPAVGGDVVGGIEMGDKVLVFKESSIYYFNGDGPGLTGQGSFGSVELVDDTVGCVDRDSLILTPVGVMFKSRKGIWLITQGLELRYIGAGVEEWNSLEIQGSHIVGDENHVRFLTSSNCLVYDYLTNLWSTFTIQGNCATIWDNKHVYGGEDSSNSGLFIQGDHYRGGYSLKLETGWITWQTLQNFARVKRMYLLGEYKSSHRLVVDIAYDYKNFFEDQSIFNTTGVVNESIYGDTSDPYGEDEVYGGSGVNTYQFEKHMKIQKCESIKFRIYDIANETDNNSEEGYTLSEITLMVGIKKGGNKMAANRKIG